MYKFSSFLTIFLFIYNSAVFCQDFQWAKRIGGTQEDIVNAIATDKSGNSVITGKFKNTLNFDETRQLKAAPNQFDGFVVKYDSTGNVIWAKEFGGMQEDNGINVAMDESGNVYLTGYFRSEKITFGAFNFEGNGKETGFVAKIDVLGKFTWVKKLNENTSSLLPVGIAVNEDGVFISATYEYSDLVHQGTSITNKGKTDIACMLLSKGDGSLKWIKSLGRKHNDYAETVSIDNNGNCFLSGRTFGYFGDIFEIDGFNMILSNNYNSFVVKYDKTGNALWFKQFKGKNGSYLDGIEATSIGDIFVSGFFGDGVHTIGDTSFLSEYSNNFYITKFNSFGIQDWTRTFKSGEMGRINGIASDKNFNLYISGFTGGNILGENIALTGAVTAEPKFFLIKVDETGNKIMADQFGLKISSTATDILASDDNGNIFVAGSYSSEILEMGVKSLKNFGQTDGFIAKYIFKPFPEPVIDIANNELSIQEIVPVAIVEKKIEPITKTSAVELRKEREAKKAEEAKINAEIKKAELAKINAEVKKAEEEKITAQAKKAEEAKITAEAKKAAEALKKENAKLLAEAKKAKAIQKPQLNAKTTETQNISTKQIQTFQTSKSDNIKDDEISEPKYSGEVISPNPTTGAFSIHLPITTQSVILKDSEDNIVFHDFKLHTANTIIKVDITEQKAGNYTIFIKGKDNKEIVKTIIKQ